MHPLSLFPSLLAWSQVSPLLIRVVLGAVFVYWAYKTLRNSRSESGQKIVGIIEGLAGILLILGLWSQAAALVTGIDLLVRLVGKIMAKKFLSEGVNYYLILLVLAISILVTGAGFAAFDLPL